MIKYRTKTNTVEAAQVKFDVDILEEIVKWGEGAISRGFDGSLSVKCTGGLIVRCHTGHWIIKDERGILSEMDDLEFNAKYEFNIHDQFEPKPPCPFKNGDILILKNLPNSPKMAVYTDPEGIRKFGIPDDSVCVCYLDSRGKVIIDSFDESELVLAP